MQFLDDHHYNGDSPPADDNMGWVPEFIGLIGNVITNEIVADQREDAARADARRERRLAEDVRLAAEAQADASRARAAELIAEAEARSQQAITGAWARPGVKPGIVKAAPWIAGGAGLLLVGLLVLRGRK